MKANRRVPVIAANNVEESAIALEPDDLAHRVGTYIRVRGARPLDNYSNQNTPMRFVCGGSCGGNIHQITWAALRAGQAPCCPACRNARLRGAEHHRFDPAISDDHRARRRSAADRRWEQTVLLTNASTCIITGRRGSAPHHLYGYDTHPDLRLLVQNGVCLTRRLHRQFHDQFGYGGNTFVQFVTFFEANTGQKCPLLDPLDIAELDQVFVD